MKKTNQSGFSHHFLLLLIVVLGVSLIGVRVLKASHADPLPKPVKVHQANGTNSPTQDSKTPAVNAASQRQAKSLQQAQTMEKQLGDEYGGAYLDQKTGKLTVYTTKKGHQSLQNGTVNAAGAAQAGTNIHDVNFSYKQLKAFQKKITDQLATAKIPFSISIDDQNNRLVISVDKKHVTNARKAASSVPNTAYVIHNDFKPSKKVASTSRDQYSPYWAGNDLILGYLSGTTLSTTSYCTSGFVVANMYGYFGTTAGHCVQSSSNTVTGGYTIYSYNVASYHVGGSVDIAAFSIPQSLVTPHTIIHTIGYFGRVVRGMGSVYQGEYVCHTGVTTNGETCGNVIYSSTSFCMSITSYTCQVVMNDVIYTSFLSLPGDSGGPVYSINSDGSANAIGSDTANDPYGHSYVTKLSNDLNYLHAVLVVR